MKRPCTCDLADCYLCNLFNTDPAYTALWATPQPEIKWPRLCRLIGRRRVTGDRGIGDTLARQFGRLGADRLATLYKRLTGLDCGCADRQRDLNERFPYA